MHIRLARADDIPATATLSVPAFTDDELYQPMYPRRIEYPSHFRASFLNRYQMRFWSPDFIFYVAETDESDRAWSGTELELALLRAEEWYSNLFRLDKSLDYGFRDRFFATAPAEFEDVDEMWKLQSLATDPKFQHRGVGSMLIAWGQEQARREGICVGLTASIVGQGVYLKKGFRMYGVIPCPGFMDVPMMVWEPEGKEGSWGVYKDGKPKGVTPIAEPQEYIASSAATSRR